MTSFEQRLRDTLSHTYDIERELGGGGMSRVFVARERSLGRKVVIKLLSPELTAEVNRGRFRREIKVAAQLQHPHIVPLLSAGEHEDLVYYTMPFISGESLRSALEKNGPLSVPDVVRVLYHVSEALDYAHSEGVVHRDIKPANILRSGVYSLVTDFGVAKALNAAMPMSGMTSTGMAVGTPAYMAPEQLAGDPAADHRIDIYAVGLLAYELLAGKSPFGAATPQRILANVLTYEPPPVIEVRTDVPPSLSEIVMRCLSKVPEPRPGSARELLVALDMFSTASGEIRTTEYRVPRTQRDTPASAPVMPAPTFAAPTVEQTLPGQVQPVEPDRPGGNRRKMLVGGAALLLPIVAGAILMSQRADDEPSRADNESSGGIAPLDTAPAVAESTSAGPVAVLQSFATVVKVDSQKIADSLRRAARAAEAAKRAAAAKADSVQQVQATTRSNARGAVAGLFADANAHRSFIRGATGRGGPLGTRRKGDLQTQIDALQPFLASAGLTYEQFKAIVAESGVRIFDEFGRMVPDSLRRFAGGIN